MGIRTRFIVIMAIIFGVATILIGTASYRFSERNAMAEAKSKGQLIFNYILATRDFFVTKQQPLIMEVFEKDRFYPELMSGFVLTRSTFDLFKGSLEGYEFKQATLDPLYPPNKADAWETALIEKFRTQKEMKTDEGLMTRTGKDGREERFFYMAKPIAVSNDACLRCHGNVNDAPKDQVEIYGTDHGYNWKKGDTVAAYVVYVSVEEALSAAKKSAIVLYLIGAGCLLIALVGVWVLMDRFVVNPIVRLSVKAEEISLGKNMEEGVGIKQNDEIGALAAAIERLRISMVRILKR
ncbi:MAG: c-type heme family protein [Thermodesulfobacteriota bacterium]